MKFKTIVRQFLMIGNPIHQLDLLIIQNGIMRFRGFYTSLKKREL